MASLPAASRGLSAAGAPGSGLQVLQGTLLVGATLYFGRELLIPLVIAVLLAFVLAPVVRVLGRIWLPRPAAVLVSVGFACAVIVGMATLVGGQVTSLAGDLPRYQATVAQKLSGIQASGGLMDRISHTLREIGRSGATRPAAEAPGAGRASLPAPGAPAAAETRAAPIPVEIHSPDPTPLELVERVAEPLLGPLATAGIVVILVIFILLYREDLRDRFIRLAGARDLHRTMAAMDDGADRLARYLLAQTAMNTGYGIFIGGALWLIGVPNPLLWGFLAGLMRFVPFIGSIVAAAFPALLALAVDPGWSMLLWVVGLFALSEAIMGQVLEPLVFSQSTGLSPIAVIAAATFWTWLWGPIGLLLSVPLTVCLVVLGRHVERLQFLEVLLGDSPPLDPVETFYQRALSGDGAALADLADAAIEEAPLPDFLDETVLPALRLGQEDAQHGALAPERREAFERGLAAMLDDLAEIEPPKPGEGQVPAALPEPWQAPGAVLCLPGRGPFDKLATAMLGQALARRGFGVRIGVAEEPPRLVCLCMLAGGGSAATSRALVRRIRRRSPGIPTVTLIWAPDGAAPSLAAEGAPPLLLAGSIRQTLDQVLQVAESVASGPFEPAAPVPASAPAAALAPIPIGSPQTATP